jgi:hypothetical protein
MIRTVLITLLFPFLLQPVAGQSNFTGDKEQLFDSDELLEMTLEFDIRHFKRTKFKGLYQEAFMTYLNNNDTVTKKIKIRSRGEFRREYCDFPPIRLNLKKNEHHDDIFTDVDKIKMVTHCKGGYDDFILKEYLIYKLYNVISDYSFRARLLKVTYIDTRKPDRPFSEYAFLIEPTEFLTERTNTNEVEYDNLNQAGMRQEIIDRVALFNYMIGNYDWTVPRLHNLVVLSRPFSENSHRGIPVPYDFDYSGLVNANYAVPPEDAPVKSVRERLYLGLCRSEDEFRKVTDHFREKKEDLYKIIEEFPYLKVKSKKEMINYLDSFYVDFDQHNTIVSKLLKNCRDIK